jgi:hypothetical protein
LTPSCFQFSFLPGIRLGNIFPIKAYGLLELEYRFLVIEHGQMGPDHLTGPQVDKIPIGIRGVCQSGLL